MRKSWAREIAGFFFFNLPIGTLLMSMCVCNEFSCQLYDLRKFNTQDAKVYSWLEQSQMNYVIFQVSTYLLKKPRFREVKKLLCG